MYKKLHNDSIRTDSDLFGYIGQRLDPKNFKPSGSKLSTQLRCPAHNDSNPSLTFTVENGIALIDCKAGCSKSAILFASGLTMPDLFLYDKDTGFSPKVKQSAVKPIESPEVLKGIDDSDTAERQAKRQSWAFSELTEEDYCAIRARYGFPVPVLKLLADNRILFKWHDTTQNPCWCLTDGSLESRHSAQAVRLDGEPFPRGYKKMTLPCSLTSYPIGWGLVAELINHFRTKATNGKQCLEQCLFLVCEGVTDYLAAWCLAARFNMVFHFPMVLPLGILGAGTKPTAEIV